MKKYVYLFEEGNAGMRSLLGGKGANLAEMTGLGLPVPPGFTISTEACIKYFDDGRKVDSAILADVRIALAEIERKMNKKFGDAQNPLLVSVRSGAAISMPGMMDTILNLGLNDETVAGLAAASSNPRFAYDSYRRFMQMFANVVMEMDMSKFEHALERMKEARGVANDSELTAEDMIELVKQYKEIYFAQQGEDFPQDPSVQLEMAIEAVFRSWDNPRANVYRKLNDIPYNLGTAVNVQSMVFGNLGNDSGTGVAFTRSPSTGENKLFGEFLMNAQGEDVVAGIRTPQPIAMLKEQIPEAHQALCDIAEKLEKHFRDMQDLEFTIERGKLYMLQTRNGKRTTAAALQVAVDMVAEGMISTKEAVMMVDAKQLDSVLHPTFAPQALKKAKAIATGLPASPGAASGKVYFTAVEAEAAAAKGEEVILVREETSPEDIMGMNAANGILTARGGMTSHAAVVARGMGKCCVAGCKTIHVDSEAKTFVTADGKVYKEGDWISLDGSTGNVYGEEIPTTAANLSGNYETIMKWADEVRTLGVYTNADSPRDAAVAVRFGAEGIGLCRTEHMFFDEDRIFSVRKMIVAQDKEAREAALAELLPMQKQDFKGIYQAMEGRPVVIRLLDPPLHEFLPTEEEDIQDLAKALNVTVEDLKLKIEDLHEFNPMLGHRGCRLSVTFPEIAVMQATAIMEAAIEVSQENDFTVEPKIMVPLICERKEMAFVKKIIVEAAEKTMEAKGYKVKYQVGTMIEIPRAALTADEIAQEAEFFSFGTNDLSQMTFGFSRDDAGKFLNDYYDYKIFESDPFAKVDQVGVGKLMRMAVADGRSTRADLSCGICGEHGGDPSTIEFCHKIGLNYVSCSPYRVPIARLAAAQAAILQRKANI